MNRKWVLILWLLSTTALAQTNRYMVFFSDKEGTPYSLSNPQAYLSDKALQRRQNQQIAIQENDLPVSPTYVQLLKDEGVKVLYTTRWMNGALIESDEALIAHLESLAFVDSVRLVAPGVKNTGGRVSRKLSNREGELSATDLQTNMLGIPAMHEAGFKGEGITIAVFDAGFLAVNTASTFEQLWNEGRLNVEVSYDFVGNQPDVFRYDDHGTRVLSAIAGFSSTYLSGAYKSNIQLYITEDATSEYRVEEYNWLFAAERADSAGADIINTSLGYSVFNDASMNYTTEQMNGATAIITRAANLAASKGILLVTSAGNEGNSSWGIITAPADSPNTLAVGAITSTGVKSGFSSVGPSADGRVKPDVVALGSGVTVINGSGNEIQSNGTSFSGPLITGLAAGIWQKYPDLTNYEILDVIRSIGSQAANPDNVFGYGIPHFERLTVLTALPEAIDSFDVYPNPTSGLLLLSSSAFRGIVQIHLVDCFGRALQKYSLSVSENPVEFNIESLPTGFYMLIMQVPNSQRTFKVIKL
jgi:subtilisin family serine protease